MFDKNYKKALAENLNIIDLNLLSSIVGEEELRFLLANIDENAYKPGVRLDFSKVDTFDDSNIDSGIFRVNLHVHTNSSDGLADVHTILENALKFADKTKKTDSPFILGITDHDSVEGIKKAIEIISQNPEKYKNLKVVPGVEVSTVITKMKGLKQTLDVHTLLYCINPFDKNLNTFLNDKSEKKFALAKCTIEKLNKELHTPLFNLDLSLNLEEAAKIHPMILKGQDEVSHPLKKYVFGKFLFRYYVENNEELLKKLLDMGVKKSDLSYEKVVYKFKSMFNNTRYFYIYKEALEKYLAYITDYKYNEQLETMPVWLEESLLKAKELCEESHPSEDRKSDAFSEFNTFAAFVSTLDYGLMSIAHPARINLKKTNLNTYDLYETLFSNFVENGKNKAFAYEKYYQSYTGEKQFSCLKDINKAADKYELSSTGGVDSHGYSVNLRCPYS